TASIHLPVGGDVLFVAGWIDLLRPRPVGENDLTHVGRFAIEVRQYEVYRLRDSRLHVFGWHRCGVNVHTGIGETRIRLGAQIFPTLRDENVKPIRAVVKRIQPDSILSLYRRHEQEEENNTDKQRFRERRGLHGSAYSLNTRALSAFTRCARFSSRMRCHINVSGTNEHHTAEL